MQDAKAKGCDALDPDNVDGFDNTNTVGITQQDSVNYVRWLAQTGHSLGMAVGLKNAAALVPSGELSLLWPEMTSLAVLTSGFGDCSCEGRRLFGHRIVSRVRRMRFVRCVRTGRQASDRHRIWVQVQEMSERIERAETHAPGSRPRATTMTKADKVGVAVFKGRVESQMDHAELPGLTI